MPYTRGSNSTKGTGEANGTEEEYKWHMRGSEGFQRRADSSQRRTTKTNGVFIAIIIYLSCCLVNLTHAILDCWELSGRASENSFRGAEIKSLIRDDYFEAS